VLKFLESWGEMAGIQPSWLMLVALFPRWILKPSPPMQRRFRRWSGTCWFPIPSWKWMWPSGSRLPD